MSKLVMTTRPWKDAHLPDRTRMRAFPDLSPLGHALGAVRRLRGRGSLIARPHRTLALVVLATTQLMLVLDGAVVNIALPSMQAALNISDRGLAWVINGYALAFGGLLLLGGRAGDVFGRRRVFVVGLSMFTLASLFGGLATSGEALIAARVLQGGGAAIAGPTAMALVATAFRSGPERTKALAVCSAAAGAGTAIGLIAGGLLTAAFSWRGVMFVNVPIGVLIILAVPLVLVESPRASGLIDVVGAVLGSGGLVGIVYGLSRAGDPSIGWDDPLSLTCFGVAGLALSAFLMRQSRVPNPLLPLGLFRDRQRSVAYLVVLLVGASLSLTYFLSLHVQLVMGYGPVRAGLAFLPFAVGIAGGSWIASRLADRFSMSAVSCSGLVLAAVGVLFYRSFTAESSYLGDLLPPMLLWSTGMGLTFVPLTVAVLKGVSSHEAGIAAAVLSTMQQVGGAVGLTALVTISTAAQNDRLAGALSVLARARASGEPSAVPRTLDAVVHGFAAAYTASLLLLLGAAMVAVLLVVTKAPRPSSAPMERSVISDDL